MRYLLLYIIFPFLLSASQLIVLYPDADLSNTYKLNATDVETVHFLFIDGFKKYSKFDIIEPNEIHMCHSKECAMDIGFNYNADKIVTSRIRVLGSKIIFTGMVFNKDGTDEFTSRVTAINVEDMENAAMRLSKSLVNKDAIDEVTDIDNIIESDTEDSLRRKSLHKVGISVGYLFPFGGNGYKYIDNKDNDDSDDDELFKYNSILQLGLLNYWEFQSNKALFLDTYLNWGVGLGVDLSYNKFINREDSSPFYGAGIGFHMHSNQDLDDYHNDGIELKHGIAPSLNVGVVFFRTYDTNVICRLKYHVLVPNQGTVDHGLTFNVSLNRKMTPNKKMGYNQIGQQDDYINRYPILELLIDILLNR